MIFQTLLAATYIASVSAFVSSVSNGRQVHTLVMGIAPKPSGFANTKAGKAVILDRTKILLDKSSLIITLPIDGVSKEQIDLLRKDLPSSTKASVVKNALMRKAISDTPFAAMNTGRGLKGENMYLFIQEGEAKDSFKVLKSWAKEVKRTEPQFLPKYGAMDGGDACFIHYSYRACIHLIIMNTCTELFAGDRLEAVVNLPSRQELITKIAQGIKAVPTKLGRSVKAVPSKLGRAIGAIKRKLEDEASGSPAN